MARRRSGDRGSSTLIWPGFVDAMTALLLVLMFVLSIFMIVQFFLREELVGKDRSLQNLTAQLGALTSQLSLAEEENAFFQSEMESLSGLLDEERARITELTGALEAESAESERLSTELAERVLEIAALTSSLEDSQGQVDELGALVAALTQERDAAQAAFTDLEQRSSAIADIEAENATLQSRIAELTAAQDQAAEELSTVQTALTERDAAIAAIRAALAERDEAARQSELTLGEKIAALELALDQKREEAEETLLLLAAAEARRDELRIEAFELDQANRELSQRDLAAIYAKASLQAEREISAEGRQAVALLNTQVRQLRAEISALRLQLDAAEERDAENQVVIEDLGSRLNQALAQKVGELQRYRSEFFGRVREALGGRDDIRVVGDRFVFQSEVLFDTGQARIGLRGREQLSRLAQAIRDIQGTIPDDVNWVLRIDGHTDRVPLSGAGRFRDNWELSQARALSVVRFLVNVERLPPQRFVAAGFGEYQPIDSADTPQAYARNRRIEMRLTER